MKTYVHATDDDLKQGSQAKMALTCGSPAVAFT